MIYLDGRGNYWIICGVHGGWGEKWACGGA